MFDSVFWHPRLIGGNTNIFRRIRVMGVKPIFFICYFFPHQRYRGRAAAAARSRAAAVAPERQPGELWPPGETNTDTHEMKF